MAEDTPPGQEIIKRLEQTHRLEAASLEILDAHYEGEQPLAYMAPELVDELGDRLQQVVIHWPELVIDSVDERLDVEGFRLGGEAAADKDLWEIWQANDLDEQSQQGHVDALVMGRCYAIVGTNEDDPRLPLITVESPLEVVATRDPRTRKIKQAVKWWQDDADDRPRATLYLPDETSWWVNDSGTWIPDTQYETDAHGLGVVPVEEIINRPRLRRKSRRRRGAGRSDLAAVIPLSDAACKIATDMMVGAEYHAMPRRWALGFNKDDFVDAAGRPVSSFSQIAGRMWATEATSKDGAEVGQFPETSLTNFHETIRMLAQLVASISGLPPHYLGTASDNPASADAIRSSEARLIKRAERKQRSFGGSWERVQRLALRIRDGKVPNEALRMETLWRDASTPTVAQKADAAVKLHAQGLVPTRQTREDLGYSSTQIARMETEDAKAVTRILGGDVVDPPAKPDPEDPDPEGPGPEPGE